MQPEDASANSNTSRDGTYRRGAADSNDCEGHTVGGSNSKRPIAVATFCLVSTLALAWRKADPPRRHTLAMPEGPPVATR